MYQWWLSCKPQTLYHNTETGRQAHLDGPIAKALMAKAAELLAEAPSIHKIALPADKH